MQFSDFKADHLFDVGCDLHINDLFLGHWKSECDQGTQFCHKVELNMLIM